MSESVGESGRLGINLASSPTFEASDSSDVSSPSLGEEGIEGEGEEAAVLLSLGVPIELDLVDEESDPPLLIQGERRDSKLVCAVINDIVYSYSYRTASLPSWPIRFHFIAVNVISRYRSSIEFHHHFDSHSMVTQHDTLDAERPKCRHLLTHACTIATQQTTYVLVSAALSRCLLFLNQLLT